MMGKIGSAGQCGHLWNYKSLQEATLRQDRANQDDAPRHSGWDAYVKGGTQWGFAQLKGGESFTLRS